jgi:hypothetical protein
MNVPKPSLFLSAPSLFLCYVGKLLQYPNFYSFPVYSISQGQFDQTSKKSPLSISFTESGFPVPTTRPC